MKSFRYTNIDLKRTRSFNTYGKICVVDKKCCSNKWIIHEIWTCIKTILVSCLSNSRRTRGTATMSQSLHAFI
jgi:hypothetical protein